MEKKLCPLKANVPEGTSRECDGDKCGWWDNQSSCCIVISITAALQMIFLKEVNHD